MSTCGPVDVFEIIELSQPSAIETCMVEMDINYSLSMIIMITRAPNYLTCFSEAPPLSLSYLIYHVSCGLGKYRPGRSSTACPDPWH